MSKYNIMYVYDVSPKNPKETVKIKRKFYYYLSKMQPFIRKATKSVIIISKEHEKVVDNFFTRFSEDLIVYKCEINKMEILKGGR